MDNFEEKINTASPKELQEMKLWLFQENVRLAAVSGELEEKERRITREKEQFQKEVRMISSRISKERKRLKEDETFFQKKMDILKNGFWQLDADRHKLNKEWEKLHAQEKRAETAQHTADMDVSVFFRGVRNPLALKKRYRDLIKIFHPDNLAGDKEMIQRINKEYELLKETYERSYKQA